MYRKQLTLTTLCFLIQLCFIAGLPTPGADPPKDAAATADASKPATEEASKSATEEASKSATDEATKSTLADSASATTDASKTAADVLAELKLTPEQLAALKAAVSGSSTGANPLAAFNPAAGLQSLFGSITPLNGMLTTSIDGATNIYTANRPNAVKFAQMASEPFLQIPRALLASLGLGETVDKFRSLGIKAVMDNTDNLVQVGNLAAHTVPTVLSTIQRTGTGLVDMQPLSF